MVMVFWVVLSSRTYSHEYSLNYEYSLQEEERRLRDEHVNYLESEALWEEDRKRRIRMFEEQAKKRAAYAVWQKRKEIQRMDVSSRYSLINFVKHLCSQTSMHKGGYANSLAKY